MDYVVGSFKTHLAVRFTESHRDSSAQIFEHCFRSQEYWRGKG